MSSAICGLRGNNYHLILEPHSNLFSTQVGFFRYFHRSSLLWVSNLQNSNNGVHEGTATEVF